MTDEPLIQKLMSASDTLSRGAAEQAIRIVREHDRRVDVERVSHEGQGTHERYRGIFVRHIAPVEMSAGDRQK